MRRAGAENAQSIRRILTDPRHRGTGCVYFIGSMDMRQVKIGYTSESEPGSRKRNIQVCSPWPMSVIGYCRGNQALERALHAHFDQFRWSGEWFFLSQSIIEAAAIASEMAKQSEDAEDSNLTEFWQAMRSAVAE